MKRLTLITALSFCILSAWVAGPIYGAETGGPVAVSVGQLVGLSSYQPTKLTIGEKGLTYKNETMKEPTTLSWDEIVQWRFFVPKLAEADDLTKDYYNLSVSTKEAHGKDRVHFVFSGTLAEAWEIQRALRKMGPDAELKAKGY